MELASVIFFVRCAISCKDVLHARKRPSRLLAATTETRQVQSPKKIARVLTKRDQRHGRGQKLAKIMRPHLQQSLSEWPSSLEEVSSEGGLVMENWYSTLMFKTLHILCLGLSRILKNCLTQHL